MEQLKKLLAEAGYNDTDIEKITGAVINSKYVPENYIPKARLDEEIAKKKNFEEQVNTLTKQVDEIKKNAGDNEDLKKQLEQAKEETKKVAKEGEAKFKEFLKETAIKNAYADKVHNADVVYGMLDKTKLIYNEETKQVVGLDEQLEALKQTNAWVFKAENQAPAGGGYVPPQGSPTPPPNPVEKSAAVLRAERLAHKPQPQNK